MQPKLRIENHRREKFSFNTHDIKNKNIQRIKIIKKKVFEQ